MKNQLKTIALLGGLSALLVAIGGVISPGALWIFAAIALAMNFGAYFFSDRIVLAMHRAKEIDRAGAPRLHAIVEELAEEAQIPKPRVFILPDASPNAFATGRNPAHGVVAVTQGIMDILDERELRGVIAHELAHIKNRDILVSTIAAAIATLVTYAAHALSFAAMFGGRSNDDEDRSPLAGILLAIVAPIAATLIQLGISRSREYLADETGAKISGDPLALARALGKLQRSQGRGRTADDEAPMQAQPATASLFIVSPLAGAGGVLSLFSTHPPVEDRIRRLSEMRPQGHAAMVA